MNKNTLRLFMSGALLGALMSPTSLFALGLGDLRLNSALNQPFDGEIEIASATPDELNSIRVGMANEDTFKRSGLDRPAFLSSFNLRVETSGGRPVIKLRSNTAITEPFVNLLVDVSWTGGRVLRQYTVLLDPPVFAQTPTTDESSMMTARGQTEEANPATGTIDRSTTTPAASEEAPAASSAPTVPSPTTSNTTAMPLPTPQAAPMEESAPSGRTPSRAQTSYEAGDNYAVKKGDTLSKIASQLRTEGVSTKQLMVALYRANTSAFGSDMNVLRSGAVLRVPATADIEAISPSEASSEVSRQYGIWRNSTVNREAAAPSGERLRLVPAQQTEPEQSSATSAASKAAAAAEKAAKEQAARKAAEEAEAKRLLELKNAELAKMQKQLSSASSTATKSAAATSAASASVTSEVAESAPTEPAPNAEPIEPEVTATKPVAPAPAPSPGLLDTLQQYWIQILGVGVVLILGLVFYFRRKQQASEESDSTIATMTAMDFDEQLRGTGRSRARGFADEHVEEQPIHDSYESNDYEPPVASAPTVRRESPSQHVLSEDTLSSETALHIEQQDALAEADFHMAYGLYDQAADIVKLAIERDPDRRDLMLKLAEIYFVWGNRDMFLDAARKLHDTRKQAAPGEWDKVVIMGKQICPDDPLFSGDRGRSSSGDNVDVNLEGGEHRVDVDLYDSPSGEQPKAGMDFELERSGSYSGNRGDSGLDFLLDEPQRGVDNDSTREMDPNARTQETPTIEAPYLEDLPDTGTSTIREQFDASAFGDNDRAHEPTSEISLDEIGLHVDSLESTGRIDNTGSVQMIGDDDATRIAKREDLEPTREQPRPDVAKTMLAPHMNMDDYTDMSSAVNEERSSSTITVEQIDLNEISGLIDMTDAGTSDSGMFKPTQKIDVDMGRFDLHADDTIEQLRPDLTGSGVYRATQKIDVDFLDHVHDNEATKQMGQLEGFENPEDTGKTSINKGLTSVRSTPTYAPTEAMEASLELPEMEPVTMSEVGTKLDLARAYMDMGDPDGARSILKEVMDEGNPGQKQEAQRLLESIG
ncbi:MAG TPA: FimV/HubP family polar landmark protein [Steroidobacteraceae bacterium]|nr:FimV/HubP family polar landmark protein [Steroidobacteraceae bacterium]